MGDGLWVPVAVPSVGVLCFRAWWEASSESPWVFGDASRLHELKRLCLFRRDKVPARNTDRPSGFAFTPRKKVFEGSKGRFFKNAPWQGVGQRPTKGERTIPTRLVFSDGTKSRHETLTDRPALPLCPQKVFEGSKGRFSKTRSWQGEGGVPQKEIQTLSKGTTVKAGNLTKSLQKPYRTMGEGRKGFCYTVGATKTTKKG